MNDELETLLVTPGVQMDEILTRVLKRDLANLIEEWLSESIESGPYEPQDYPWIGPRTTWLMASAAINVLQAIYDAETGLVAEGRLDPDGVMLPKA